METESMIITFGEECENGFCYKDLKRTHLYFKKRNIKTRLINLKATLVEELDESNELEELNEVEEAYLLIIKCGEGLKQIADDLYSEQKQLIKDENVPISKDSFQKDSFPKGLVLKHLTEKFKEIIGNVGGNLQSKVNYYKDFNKCIIPYHGDSRRKIIEMRLGNESIPLNFVWFKDGIPVSNEISISDLNHGDLYIMTNKTTGFDWKNKKIYTIRHSCGYNVNF